MPKLSQVLRDQKRERLIEKNREKRAALRKILKDENASIDEKLEAQGAFAKLGRNSCAVRRTRRCNITGRSKSVYRKFGLSRIALREMGLRGELPGVRKSSW